MIIRWLLYLIPALLIEGFCWITAPVAALFVVKRLRTDRVKRLNNEVLTFDREYLWGWFSMWATHDNAVDEYWWGMFTDKSVFEALRKADQWDYNHDAGLRYLCRLLWVWRNTGYGFAYNWFGRTLDQVISTKAIGPLTLTTRVSSWQLKGRFPIGFGYCNDINIGWKEHSGFDRVMYASRVIGIRKNNKELKD